MLRIIVKTTDTAAGSGAALTAAEVRLEAEIIAGPEPEVQKDFTASHRHIAGDNVKSSLCILGKKIYFGDILRRASGEQ